MLRLLDLITGNLPDLKAYTIKPPETKKRATVAPSAMKKEEPKEWLDTPKSQLPDNVVFESVKATAATSLDLDDYDIQSLAGAKRFGVDKYGFLSADIVQAKKIKAYRSAGRSIDDVVNAHKGQVGWSRANVAKFYGAFRDAEAERQSKMV